MLIAKVSDQLGNQMFAYAAVKTIALDAGFEFKLYPDSDNILINDTHGVLGHKIESIFEIPRSECIKKLPSNMPYFQEKVTLKSKSCFVDEALSQGDNTIMGGHYICPKYFNHRIKEVRKWFQFPEIVESNIDKKIAKIRAEHKNCKLVSVHIRNAKDYRESGFLLKASYWDKAAELILDKYEERPIFLVFYDTKTKLVKNFLSKFHCIDMRESLIEDMCAISKCDYHIVCNSSFSIISALLDEKDAITIRPSTFPVPYGYAPTDRYPSTWLSMPGRKNYWSEVSRVKKIPRKLKVFLLNCSSLFFQHKNC